VSGNEMSLGSNGGIAVGVTYGGGSVSCVRQHGFRDRRDGCVRL
jgi:hypothetical protein